MEVSMEQIRLIEAERNRLTSAHVGVAIPDV